MQRASQDQTYDKVNMGIHFGHFESFFVTMTFLINTFLNMV